MSASVPMSIRSFRAEDQLACRHLFSAGRIGGIAPSNDLPLDVYDIERWYMQRPGNHFWVAEQSGRLVGMIGVQHFDAGAAEIRRLRVLPEIEVGNLAELLVEEALRFCGSQQYLKITLDTYLQAEPAITLFEKHGFKHSASRTIEGRPVHYFYADLYHRPQR